MKTNILVPPQIFIGELFPWKGKFWRVQLYDPAGGLLEWRGETSGEARAISQNPILVLEMQGDTTGAMKRQRGKEKRHAHRHKRV